MDLYICVAGATGRPEPWGGGGILGARGNVESFVGGEHCGGDGLLGLDGE